MAWIQHPIEIDTVQSQQITDVPGLNTQLKEALLTEGLEALLPAQAGMWKICCGGLSSLHDICLCFPTGAGKTLAYLLPILNNLLQTERDSIHCLRALIVLPTKTLLKQVLSVLAVYCDRFKLRLGTIGLSNISDEMQMFKATATAPLFDGLVDILIATPGRLAAHLNYTLDFSLKLLQFMVLDEADHLIKRRHHGFLPDLIKRLHRDSKDRCTGSRVQKIVVSATISHDLRSLSELNLHKPRLLCPKGSKSQRYKFPEGLKHTFVIVPAPLCPLAIVGMLHRAPTMKTLVFASTTSMARKLTELLQNVEQLRDRVIECSGELAQTNIDRAIKTFKKREACVLVATDVMARGMDIDNIDQVISYDTPVHAKTYLHRVGRTARVDRSGVACCMLRKGMDERSFEKMTKKLGVVVEQETLSVEELRELKPKVDAVLDGMRTRRRRK